MLCRSIDELSIKYIENELEESIRYEFEKHMTSCRKCRIRYSEIKNNYNPVLKADAVDLRLSVMNRINSIKSPGRKANKYKLRFGRLIIGFAEVLVLITVMFIMPALVKQFNEPNSAVTLKSTTPEEFLKDFNLDIQGEPEGFKVDVPQRWDVKAGEYPAGLYWRLANEFSKEAGLDLTDLKGKTVEVRRYSLKDGLPGQGEQSQYEYPSDVTLLIDNGRVAGAWLNFNKWGIGPSVKKHYLKDITGLDFEQWAAREGIFSDLGKNSDIASLEPVEVLKAFFKAINDGDKIRANSCLTPGSMLNSLTMNPEKNHLYNSGFNTGNSMVENIKKANPVSFKLMDTKDFSEIKEIGTKEEVEIAVTLQIEWKDSAFNTPDGAQERFAILKKYKNGWRVEGLGTGP